jgi:hypothetical protein
MPYYAGSRSVVVVKRDDHGSIEEIVQQSPFGSRRSGLHVLFISGCFLLLFPWLMQFLNDPRIDLAAALKIDLLAVFVLFLVGLMSQPGIMPKQQAADRNGINFNYYPSLGQIPWTDIDGIDFRGSSLSTFMASMLVVRLKNSDDWIGRLKPGSDFDPRRGSRMPFAALVDSNCVDIHALQTALLEMQAQMKGNSAPSRVVSGAVPPPEASAMSEPITFGRHLER